MNDAFEELFGSNQPLRESSEKRILNETLVAVSALPNTLVFRNNTGMAWQGKPLELKAGDWFQMQPGMMVLAQARPIRFGLEGSGDVIGASCGTPIAIETKKLTGRQRQTQERFEEAWVKAGGVYVLARSPQDAVSVLREF